MRLNLIYFYQLFFMEDRQYLANDLKEDKNLESQNLVLSSRDQSLSKTQEKSSKIGRQYWNQNQQHRGEEPRNVFCCIIILLVIALISIIAIGYKNGNFDSLLSSHLASTKKTEKGKSSTTSSSTQEEKSLNKDQKIKYQEKQLAQLLKDLDQQKKYIEDRKKQMEELRDDQIERKKEIEEYKKQIQERRKDLETRKQELQLQKKEIEEQKQKINLEKTKRQSTQSPKIESITEYKVKKIQKIALDIGLPDAPEPVEKHTPSPDHIHDPATTWQASPTMGSPESQKVFNSTPVPKEGFIEFDSEILRILKPYNDTDCEFTRYGEGEDGSYIVCNNFLAHSEAMINIGINGFDGLGCQITTNFPMPNYQYDCTNPSEPVCSTNNKADLFTYACIGESTEKTPKNIFYSLEDVIKRHNLTRKYITLKIDCEGCEWQGFKNFPLDFLQYIDQIFIEMHFRQISPEIWGNLDIIRAIDKYFVNVNLHSPYWLCIANEEKSFRRLPSITLEATLVNRRLIKLHSESRSYEIHPLNFRACPTPDEITFPKSIEKVVQLIGLPDAPEPVEKHTPSPDHIHDPATTWQASPTMGSPESQKVFNSTPVPKEGLIEFDLEVLRVLKPYNDTDCEFTRYGEGEDGSYIVCNNFLAHSEAMINIGINGFDGLGCQITTNFPMPNYQYDCTNPSEPVCSTNNKADLFTYACIGESTEKTPKNIFYSLEDVIKRHNLTRKYITLKIDCEGCEWQGFKNFPLDFLQYIDQIFIEMHFQGISPEIWGNLDIIRAIDKYFVNVNLHSPYWLCIDNNEKHFRRLPSITLEATLVNRRLIKLHSESRSYEIHPLNFRACPTPDEITFPKSIEKVVQLIGLPDAPEPVEKHTPSPDHIHDPATTWQASPTMGSPESQKVFNSTPVPKEGFIEFDSEILRILKPYNDTDCEFTRYGEGEDGSYIVCNNFLAHSEAMINIGINGFDGLGCQITTNFPMPNYQYDCTNPSEPVCSTNNKADLFTYACIGESTEKTPKNIFYSLEDVIKRHNLTRKYITLKIDCEGCEWQGFKNFPLDFLQYIDQIFIQMHFRQISPEIWGNLDIVRAISKYFVNVNLHAPYWLCTPPNELSFRRLPSTTLQASLVNKRLIKLHSQSRSFAYNVLNYKGCPTPDEMVFPKSIKKIVTNIGLPDAPEPAEDHKPTPSHIHPIDSTVLAYPTMGVPLMRRQFNSTPVSKQGFIEFDQKILRLLKPYNDTDCELAGYGEGEGRYFVCKNFLSHSEGMINIGIDGEDSLGCQLTTVESMVNYQYDCTNPKEPVCETNNGANHFSSACLGQDTEKSSDYIYYSLEDMIKRHNLTRKAVTLKINCQGCEWNNLRNFALDYLQYFDQIIIKFYFEEKLPQVWGNLQIIESLSKYFVTTNIYAPSAHCFPEEKNKERKIPGQILVVTFVNKKLIELSSKTRSFAPHALNIDSCPFPS